jgi:hypothetical protein
VYRNQRHRVASCHFLKDADEHANGGSRELDSSGSGIRPNSCCRGSRRVWRAQPMGRRLRRGDGVGRIWR